jgi:hypothetical protein
MRNAIAACYRKSMMSLMSPGRHSSVSSKRSSSGHATRVSDYTANISLDTGGMVPRRADGGTLGSIVAVRTLIDALVTGKFQQGRPKGRPSGACFYGERKE